MKLKTIKYGMEPGRVHLNPNTSKLLMLNTTEYDILLPEFKLSANIYLHMDIQTNNFVLSTTVTNALIFSTGSHVTGKTESSRTFQNWSFRPRKGHEYINLTFSYEQLKIFSSVINYDYQNL